MDGAGGVQKSPDDDGATSWTTQSTAGAAPREKERWEWGSAGAVLIACLMTLPFLVFLFGGQARASVFWLQSSGVTMGGGVSKASHQAISTTSASVATNDADELLGGLLTAGFDRDSCRSRYQSSQYYKHSPYAPSSYLQHKLREYEARHRKCAPGTPLYAMSTERLRSGRRGTEAMECNYLVWLPFEGLGNRMLSLLSTFVYALLTGRVVLVHSPRAAADFAGLFCEPFPNTTWVLPPDFPVANLSRLGWSPDQAYRNLVAKKKLSSDPAKVTGDDVPPYVFVNVAHERRFVDRLFFCGNDQVVLGRVNWLLVYSDLYFVPSLYAVPAFRAELRRLFPAKESVAHLLARYLFHPSNSVWGMVTRYYHSYLAQATRRVGVQIRMFRFASVAVDDMYRQILACSKQEHVLPEIDGGGDGEARLRTGNLSRTSAGAGGSTAILIASLYADYYERIRWRYYEHAARGGERIGVFQPSHEERQATGKRAHDQRALAEIYLLSFSDELVTSGMSTFGYVSSSLAGLRPAMLLPAHGHKVPKTPCVRAVSMEPCNLTPPRAACKGADAVDKDGEDDIARHVKACEDERTGIKLCLGIEEVSPLTGKRQATKAAANIKRWSSAANATVVVLIMVVPPLLFLLSGRLESKKDVLLGGLLVPGFDEQMCASRYQAAYYRKNMTRQPSPYLIKRLRQQEALQRRCGPGTVPYTRASERLKSGQTDVDDVDGCSYLVLISYRGLGNRMLAIASVFLYALLTNRVLLVDRGYGNTLPDLFCEPFPGTTWALPLDFPLDRFRELGEDAPESYGNVVVNRSGSVAGLRFVYLHLDHAASPANRLVYCDDHRQFLHRVQWAVIRTDQYMAPGLFFNPAYQAELDRLFPRKDSVFYLLSRYLLHPTNGIWGMVTRFYNSYLRNADERLGIQIRVFDGDKPLQHVLDQILACTAQERLLPRVVSAEGVAPRLPSAAGARSKVVLVTGLSSWYHDNIREMYWKSATADGEVVSLFQPSHEEHQQWYRNDHDKKAAAEIYLLSLTDRIVTTAWSTFGYVGYAMGGLRPYLMFKPENLTAPNPPCTRAMSMEPCSHGAPAFECTRKEIDTIINTGVLLPHVRACEDIPWGLKLTDPA
ncbi:hypothetical protein U9M48_029319, partial [Paspalum notatum var. saurae]